MTIEKLEALERAATAGIWCADADAVVVGEDYTVSENSRVADSELIAASRNALTALLAVAKAARVLSKWTEAESDGTIKLRDDMYANNALADLFEALSQLEATP